MQLQSHHSSPIAVSHFKINENSAECISDEKIFGNAVPKIHELSMPSEQLRSFKDKNINPEKKEKMSKTRKKSCLHRYHMVRLYKKSTKLVSNWDLSFLYKLFLRALAPNIEKVKSKKDLSEITIQFQFCWVISYIPCGVKFKEMNQ